MEQKAPVNEKKRKQVETGKKERAQKKHKTVSLTPFHETMAGTAPEDIAFLSGVIEDMCKDNVIQKRNIAINHMYALIGRSGMGKTAWLYALAKKHNIPIFHKTLNEINFEILTTYSAEEGEEKLSESAISQYFKTLLTNSLSVQGPCAFLHIIGLFELLEPKAPITPKILSRLKKAIKKAQDKKMSLFIFTEVEVAVPADLEADFEPMEIPLPDEENREKIIQYYLNHIDMPKKPIKFKTMAQDSKGMSPLELKQIINKVAAQVTIKGKEKELETEDFLAILKKKRTKYHELITREQELINEPFKRSDAQESMLT